MPRVEGELQRDPTFDKILQRMATQTLITELFEHLVLQREPCPYINIEHLAELQPLWLQSDTLFEEIFRETGQYVKGVFFDDPLQHFPRASLPAEEDWPLCLQFVITEHGPRVRRFRV